MRVGATIATGVTVLVLAACGGGERQDESEPEADFPVDVATAKFPNRQRLAETTELRLGVENTGTETIPDLAVTIFIEDGGQGSFDIRLDQPGLANPNRPVWVLGGPTVDPSGLTPAVGGFLADVFARGGAVLAGAVSGRFVYDLERLSSQTHAVSTLWDPADPKGE